MMHVTVEQAVQKALWHHRAGRLAEAEALYRQVLAREPNRADALHLLGVLASQLGRTEAAIEMIGRAIAGNPEVPEYHNSLGVALRGAGRLGEAIAVYRRAIALRPDHAGVQSNLASALWEAGQRDDAIVSLRRVAELEPGSAKAHNNLGVALHETGRLDEAIAALGRAIELRPDYATACTNLGNSLTRVGRVDEALRPLRRAVELMPDSVQAHRDLGNALRLRGELDLAIAAHRRAVALGPDDASAHNGLGVALQDAHRLDEAIAAFGHAIALDPDSAGARNNLGTALNEAGRLDEAIAAFRRAIALDPGSALAQSNLGTTFKDQGRHDLALGCFQKAVELKPDFPGAASNLLFNLHFDPDHDAQALLAHHRRWANRYAEPLAAEIRPHPDDRAPDRRLRIGFVSPDFSSHPVGRLVRSLFANRDRRHAELVAYSDVRAADGVTREIEALTDRWHSIVGLGDRQVADRIRADAIDILVDLAQHTAHNRMLVFARKPAPVQVTMLGMPTTTGLATIDYRLTDAYLDPPGQTDDDYTERSIRLPHSFWCYPPPHDSPSVGELPALKNGLVTFGCLNQLAKVTRPALQALGEDPPRVPRALALVLHAPPGSHLEAIRAHFGDAGVDPDRVAFAPKVPLHRYLERYHELDLALDPFPYNGGTTSMDALWMGVPVVTLAGRTAVGRGGVSILSNLGLPELIAWTPEQYVDIALRLAEDWARLAELRAGLRSRMQASPLMDGKQYAADVEAAFRRMWKDRCGP